MNIHKFTAVLIGVLLVLSGCYGQEQENTLLLSENSNQGTDYVYTTGVLNTATDHSYTTYVESDTIPQPQVITSHEAEAMMVGEGVIILDVRTLSEFEDGHIENAILLPHYEILERAETVIPDKSYTILIYCRSGNRSNQAAHLLIEMGYISVYDFGGILSWHGEIK